MFVTTQGIVLRSYPFKDNRHITKVFTSDDGLLSFIIKKTKKQIILSQPFTIAEITYKKQKNTTLFHVKDVHVDYVYRDLLFNNEKIQLLIILAEILQKCLNAKNMELYNLIILAFKWLDQADQNYSGFNNLFLIKFCQIAGIAPYAKFDAPSTIDQQLDMKSGLFLETQKIKLSLHALVILKSLMILITSAFRPHNYFLILTISMILVLI